MVQGAVTQTATAQLTSQQANSEQAAPATEWAAGTFVATVIADPSTKLNAIATLAAKWQPGFVPMAFETLMLTRDPNARAGLLKLLEEKTGQSFGPDLRAWLQWWWRQEEPMHAEYPLFKSTLYGLLDPRFKKYFSTSRAMTIRLREVVWGGVAQDGIPPLRQPTMLSADKASYLADSDVVFGFTLNGDARAYPKRILAWHEMFVDTVGGVAVAGVYCTLCGTVIVYHTEHNGVAHELGTSGFLFRSNKLMYDKATQSLWSTMRGEPVIGPLVGMNIQLQRDALVTTTWGEWRRRHPQTTVLSLDTGYKRDYAEGVAYRAYFATDELMFPVPKPDSRLANKAEVLGLLLGNEPLAIAADYLAAHPVYQDNVGGQQFVVLTDKSGANRVYARGSIDFATFDQDATVIDANGATWAQTETALRGPDGQTLQRLPAHRAFWFGWHAAFPKTEIVAK